MQTGARGRRTVLGIALVVAAVLSAPAVAGAQSTGEFVPVTDEMLQNPAAGDWLSWRRTPDGWGYSPLDQIDRDNVHRIRMVWTRGSPRDGRRAPRWPTAASSTCRSRTT